MIVMMVRLLMRARAIGSMAILAGAAILLAGCATTNEPVRVRILTYNIHHGEGVDGVFDLERLARVISDTNPDLVALQEVDQKTDRARGVDQPAEFGRLTGMHAVFGKAMDYSNGGYGEAVLSRYPFLDVTNHILPATEGREPRAALAVRVAIGDGDNAQEIVFVGTHLDHLRDDSNRIMQMEAIIAALRDVTIPAILVGDLNAVPDSAPMALLADKWLDTSAAKPQASFPSDEPRRRIDYVLVRPANRWRVVESRVIDERIASDHRPLLVVLELVAAR